MVIIELCSPDGEALVQARTGDLSSFVERMSTRGRAGRRVRAPRRRRRPSPRSSPPRPPDARPDTAASAGWLGGPTRDDRPGSVEDRPRGPAVLFSHDTEHSLACIVDLVNSAPSSRHPGSSSPTSTRSRAFVVAPRRQRGRRRSPSATSRACTPCATLIAAVFDATDDRSAAAAVNTAGLPGRRDAPADRPRRLRLARPLLRPRRLPRRAPHHRLRDGPGPRRRLRGARAAAALRRRPTATRCSSTSPATGPSATATPAPAATGCTSPPTASASAPPAT